MNIQDIIFLMMYIFIYVYTEQKWYIAYILRHFKLVKIRINYTFILINSA